MPTRDDAADDGTESPATTVACHVRAPMLLEPIDAHVETLRACEAEGAIDHLLVRSWPDSVGLAEESPDREVLDRFERFDRWAERRGVTVRPPFEVRSHVSQVTGERRDRLVTPLICLAVYRDDELAAVFPHSGDGETRTVAEAVAALRTGELPEPLGTPAPRVATGTCPECGEGLATGQGLYACPDCGWVGVPTSDGGYARLPEEATLPVPTTRH